MPACLGSCADCHVAARPSTSDVSRFHISHNPSIVPLISPGFCRWHSHRTGLLFLSIGMQIAIVTQI